MLRAVFTVVAIAAVTVTLLDKIKPCCAQARMLQTQTTSLEPTIWDHNGSRNVFGRKRLLLASSIIKSLVQGWLEAESLRPGSLLFRGQVDNGQYSGTAYIFNPHCGPIPFQVKGPVLDNDERIMLTGQVPQVGRNCRTHGSYTNNLEFRRIETSRRSSIARSTGGDAGDRHRAGGQNLRRRRG